MSTAAVPAAPRQSLAQLAILVRDYDEAIAFYVGVLGFVLLEDTPLPQEKKRWVVVAPDRHAGARIVIANCAAPEYRDQLTAYLAFSSGGHEALSFRSSFEMHHKFAQDGDMRGVVWAH